MIESLDVHLNAVYTEGTKGFNVVHEVVLGHNAFLFGQR